MISTGEVEVFGTMGIAESVEGETLGVGGGEVGVGVTDVGA